MENAGSDVGRTAKEITKTGIAGNDNESRLKPLLHFFGNVLSNEEM
jgi:hypothetical protein